MFITEVVGFVMLIKRLVCFNDIRQLSMLCPAVGLGSSVDNDTPHLFRHQKFSLLSCCSVEGAPRFVCRLFSSLISGSSQRFAKEAHNLKMEKAYPDE